MKKIILTIILVISLLIATISYILYSYVGANMRLAKIIEMDGFYQSMSLNNEIDFDSGTIVRAYHIKYTDLAFVTIAQKFSRDDSSSFDKLFEKCNKIGYETQTIPFFDDITKEYSFVPQSYLIHKREKNKTEYVFITIFFEITENEFENFFKELQLLGRMSGKIHFLKDNKIIKSFSGKIIPFEIIDTSYLESYFIQKPFKERLLSVKMVKQLGCKK